MLRCRNRKKNLLVVDNVASHIVKHLDLKAVEVLFLPKDATSKVQPLNAGIISAVKQRYLNFHFQNELD